ncbi:phosphoenolpyruvate carboxykinase, partial [Thermococci archaeon]
MSIEYLKERLDEEQFNKIRKIKNENLHEFLSRYIDLMDPECVYVCTDSEEDEFYVKWKAIYSGEEKPLRTPRHTVHFDNY